MTDDERIALLKKAGVWNSIVAHSALGGRSTAVSYTLQSVSDKTLCAIRIEFCPSLCQTPEDWTMFTEALFDMVCDMRAQHIPDHPNIVEYDIEDIDI